MKVLHVLYSGLTGGIEILCKNFVKDKNHFLIFLVSGGEVFESVKNQNNVLCLNYSNGSEIVSDKKKVCFSIKNFAEKNKINSIVFHHPSICLLHIAIFLKKLRIQIPFFYYCHCDAFDLFKNDNLVKKKYGLYLLKKAFSLVDCVIAISEFVKFSIIKRFHLLNSKIIVIHNGILINNVITTPTYNQKCIRVLYVGRLIEEKGVQNTLLFLRHSRINNFHFSIIGDGPYRHQLEKLTKEYELIDKVSFFGTSDNVEYYYNSSDIFVHLPNWEEGFGLSIVEAMSYGLVCISNRKGAIPEIIHDRIDGFLLGDYNEHSQQNFDEILDSYKTGKTLELQKSAKKSSKIFDINNTRKNIEQLTELFTNEYENI